MKAKTAFHALGLQHILTVILGSSSFGLTGRHKCWIRMRLVVIGLVLLTVMSGCGGGSGSSPVVSPQSTILPPTVAALAPTSIAVPSAVPTTASPSTTVALPIPTVTPVLAPTQVPALTPLAQPAEAEVLFNPEEYDILCMDWALGTDISDQILHMGRTRSDAELVKIEQCLVDAAGGPRTQAETPLVPEQGSTFDRDAYDMGCADRILGMGTTDQIFHMGRTPTGAELAKLENCLVGAATREGADQREAGQPADSGGQRDARGGDGASAVKDTSVYSQRQCLRDDHGHAMDPDCNVPPKPLPPGVVAAELRDARPPDPKHKLPLSVNCESFEGEQCAELRWEPVSDLRAGEFTTIEIAPTDPNILYAGTDSNDMSVYKSADAGVTWELVDVTGHVGRIAINPDDPDIVLYTNLEAPVRRTTDGGWNWESVLSVTRETGAAPWTAIAFSPDDPNVAYTANVPGPSRGGFVPPEPAEIFVSKNAGLDWNYVGICECGAIKTLAVPPGDPDVLWAAGDGGIRVSRDGGITWSENLIYTAVRDTLAAGAGSEVEAGALGVAVRPGDSQTILASSADTGMYRSSDGGESWRAVNTGLATLRLHHVTFAPSDPDVAYVATHDGVYRSDDAGQSWSPRSEGLQYTFVTPIAVDPQDADVVYVGTATEIYTTHTRHFNPGLHEGEGLYKTTDGGQTWARSDKGIYEPKLTQMSAHPLLPFNLWVGGESGRLAFFTPDGGDTWLVSPSQAAHYPMVFAFSRSFPTVQYLTAWTHGGEIMKSTDGGASWFLLTSKIEAGISEITKSLGLVTDEQAKYHLHGLAVAPSDPNVVYVGSVHDTVYADVGFTLFGAHIFKSVDAGLSFTEMSDGFPIETHTAINVIVVHPENPDIAYAMTTLHESETAIGVYKTTDGAQSWAAVNNGLDLQTNDLQMDPLVPGTLYAATETGVYKSTDGGNIWQLSSTGLPNGPVINLALDPINPLVLYAITPNHVYRTKNGADNWYQVDLGLPLDGSSDAVAAGRAPKIHGGRADATSHRVYEGVFAQDRTLEIDATGRTIYVALKTGPEDGSVRHLYRAVLDQLLTVRYEFELQGESIPVESTSHVYDMVYDQNSHELRFFAAGPKGTVSSTTVTIPGQFLSAPFSVQVDGADVPSTNNAGSVSFEYAHSGRSAVVISGE